MKKTIRVFGNYYTESDRGRRFLVEYDEKCEVDTELTGGELRSFVHRKVIEPFLAKKFGRDKYLGWQTCQIEEPLDEAPKAQTAKAQTAKAQTPAPKTRTAKTPTPKTGKRIPPPVSALTADQASGSDISDDLIIE